MGEKKQDFVLIMVKDLVLRILFLLCVWRERERGKERMLGATCYGLNVSPQNSYVEILTPNVMV